MSFDIAFLVTLVFFCLIASLLPQNQKCSEKTNFYMFFFWNKNSYDTSVVKNF